MDSTFQRILHHAMTNSITIQTTINDEEFTLHPLKFIYWKRMQMLICADIHVGKGGHFRKHGIAIPRMANKNNFWNLVGAFELYKPEKLLVIGDMMHSSENLEWEDFGDFLDNYPAMKRILVRGNHELFADEVYEKLGFDVVEELSESGFLFLHDNENYYGKEFLICGHIHPAVSLYGSGRQTIKVPCFWQTENQLVLPAFGEFTGTHVIRPKRGDRVFAISGDEVIEMK